MRLLSVVLLAAGLAVALLGPLVWLGRLSSFEIVATTTQAGFKSTLPVYGLGKRRAIEVYDRRGGRRRARFVAADAHVHSAGDRLVITVGEDDDRRSYVVSGR